MRSLCQRQINSKDSATRDERRERPDSKRNKRSSALSERPHPAKLLTPDLRQGLRDFSAPKKQPQIKAGINVIQGCQSSAQVDSKNWKCHPCGSAFRIIKDRKGVVWNLPLWLRKASEASHEAGEFLHGDTEKLCVKLEFHWSLQDGRGARAVGCLQGRAGNRKLN